MAKHKFKKLKIWHLGMEIVQDTYILTQSFPKEEIYGITSQMRRAAVSIPSNIAEGCGRGTDPQLINFLRISIGSAYELETQLLACEMVQVGELDKIKKLLDKVTHEQKMIESFKNSL